MQLFLGFINGLAEAKVAIEHGKNTGTVSSRFTMRECRCFEIIDQSFQLVDLICGWKTPGMHSRINQCDASFFAGFCFQLVSTLGWIVATKINDGFQPKVSFVPVNPCDTRLIAPVQGPRQTETIGIERSQKTVVNEPQIKIRFH
jgi:hypothetical protein